MRQQLRPWIVVAVLALAHSVFGQSGARPNIVLIVADDLGVECHSAYGGTSNRTPHLDRLAKEGMRFTHCFSNPYCSPSRGTLTDRGTHVPLIARWPRLIQAGSTCKDLVDLSDFLPTLSELTGAKLPEQTIHGRSFAPQLFGKPGNPREWIHIQNAGDRQVGNSGYMLDSKNQLRRVVQLWEESAKPNENKSPEKKAAASKTLQAVFEELGK